MIFFTVHRCASRYVTNILKKLVEESDMCHVDIGGYLWNGGIIYTEPQNIYRKFGYLYGPFYGMDKEELIIPIENLDDFKILYMLRDPRDVLTSYYFHWGYELYSNPAVEDYLKVRSEETLAMTIDEWVLEKFPLFLERYKTYLEKFNNKPGILFIKYEDMLEDFDNWLNNIIRFIDVNVKKGTIESIKRKANFKVDKEDVKAHKRQVIPGDHKRKLKKETINILNSQFNKILDELDYKK
jgi:hypothetical protein